MRAMLSDVNGNICRELKRIFYYDNEIRAMDSRHLDIIDIGIVRTALAKYCLNLAVKLNNLYCSR